MRSEVPFPPVTQPPHVPSQVKSFLPTPLRGLSLWDHVWPQHLSRGEPLGATECVEEMPEKQQSRQIMFPHFPVV